MSRVKQKIKNKKRISYSFRLFFLFLVLVFACIAFMHSSYFAITAVKVEGTKYLTVRQVLELCEIEKGANIFSLNYKSLTKQLRTNCWVEDVEIKRRLPDKVIIRIKESRMSSDLERQFGLARIGHFPDDIDLIVMEPIGDFQHEKPRVFRESRL